MAEDINNLKTEVAVINNKLDNLADKQDEIIDMLKSHMADEEVNRKHILDTKADKKEVDEIKSNLNKVVWIILTCVIGAVLSLIIIK